jgi:hypothetical protein
MMKFIRWGVFTLVLVVLPLAAFAQVNTPRAKTETRAVLKGLSHSTSSQGGQPWIEWEQRMNADQRLTAFGPDLLGDQIDPATGAISFEHTDVALPGNSRLEVAIRRRLTQGYLYGEGVNAEFGNWEHLVPRIVAISGSAGWTGSRCSNSFHTSFPPIQRGGTYVYPGGWVMPLEPLQSADYSNGVRLEVPGQPAQKVLESPHGAHWPVERRYTTTEKQGPRSDLTVRA